MYRKIKDRNDLFTKLASGSTVAKPHLYKAIMYSVDYCKWRAKRQAKRDMETLRFLRTKCGATGRTLKESLK